MSKSKPPVPCRAGIVCDGSVPAKVYDRGPEDDATWDGASVVCDGCYIAVEPLMKLNRDDVPHEADAAVDRYRRNMSFLQAHERPEDLVAEAEAEAAKVTPGSPYHVSASYMASLAKAEVDRRAGA